MSRYLIDRIRSLPNVFVHPNSEIGRLDADESGLASVGLKKPLPDGTDHFDTRHLFLFTGADPNTDWLRTCGVELDEKGFVLTGTSADGASVCDLATTVEGVSNVRGWFTSEFIVAALCRNACAIRVRFLPGPLITRDYFWRHVR